MPRLALRRSLRFPLRAAFAPLTEAVLFVALLPLVLILAAFDQRRRPRHPQPLLEDPRHRA